MTPKEGAMIFAQACKEHREAATWKDCDFYKLCPSDAYPENWLIET